jgi:hypothetical protein
MTEPPQLPELWQRRRDLAGQVLGKRRLYLDIKFWSYLCDVILEEDADPDRTRMTSAIRAGVADGWLVCPIEFHTFVELIKQSLASKRALTAELIDELSGGITVITQSERVFIEVLRFLQSASSGPPFPSAPINEVWTKVAYLIGHGSLHSTRLQPDQVATLNRAFAERLWSMPLTEILALLGNNLQTNEWQAATATSLNTAKAAARDRVASFRELYRDEFRGMLDAFATSIGDTMAYLFERAGGDNESVTETQRDVTAQSLIALIAAVQERHDLSRQLPTVHIMATLFSSVQWDRHRKYKANDFADFGHATAALAYCDAFATERSLGTLIRQTRLDTFHDCGVLFSPVALVDWLVNNRAA